MPDYTALATKAKTLVDAAGRSVTFVRYDKDPANASEPWKGPADPRAVPEASDPLIGAFVEPSSAVRLGIATADSDLVKRSQQIILVAPGPGFSGDLSKYHEVIDGAERWSIGSVEKLRPANVTLLYFIGVRR